MKAVFRYLHIVFQSEVVHLKRIIIFTFICTIILCGCFYQPELRPRLDNPEVWICEKPYAELHWDELGGSSKIIIDDITYEIVFSTTAGPQLSVYEKETEDGVYYGQRLFRGHTTYKEDSAVVRVEEDFKNIFGGELPTLHFKRYKKDDLPERKKEE